MSSFGDGNIKTEIERELNYIAKDNYGDDFLDNKEAQRDFVLAVLDVLRYLCGEW